jgi:hypothetical protein
MQTRLGNARGRLTVFDMVDISRHSEIAASVAELGTCTVRDEAYARETISKESADHYTSGHTMGINGRYGTRRVPRCFWSDFSLGFIFVCSYEYVPMHRSNCTLQSEIVQICVLSGNSSSL